MSDPIQDILVSSLVERGLISPAAQPSIEPLGGGISNVVLKVSSGEDCIVIKHPLPKLRVRDEWYFDQSRIVVEHDCMVLLGELLPVGSVPKVRFFDRANLVLGMSCAPADGYQWKQRLLAGEIDLEVAQRAGQLLADVHNYAAKDPRTPELFGDNTVFLQGRVDPYHLTAAKRHPDLAPLIEAEVERMLETRVTLVHGDYSPKNIFVGPWGLLILDFEVAHYGDPAFDTAFCLNHLVLKAVKFPGRSPSYLQAASGFWRSYANRLASKLHSELEVNSIRELGCLLLARIDGKSKIEYITDEPTRDLARGLARQILTGSEETIDSLLARIGAQLGAR